MSAPVHPADPQTAPRPAPAPRLRVVRVPTPQPPLADEPVRLVLPGVAVPRTPHRPGPRPRPERAPHPDADFGPSFSSRADLPDPRIAGRNVLVLAVEVFDGRRPMTQLRPKTSPGLFAALARGRRPQWCVSGTAPIVFGPVHLTEPVDGVAEVSLVARRAGRAHALAARLEGLDGRWRCTALQIG